MYWLYLEEKTETKNWWRIMVLTPKILSFDYLLRNMFKTCTIFSLFHVKKDIYVGITTHLYKHLLGMLNEEWMA